MEYLLNFGMIIGGLVLLVIGGELIVRGAVGIARHFKVPTVIIGLTIVAIGTSAPEIFVSIQAALSSHPDIAMGNIVGSNISNILLVMGLSAIIYPIAINHKIITRDAPFLVFISALLMWICFTDFNISQIEGAGLIALLVAYIAYTVRSAAKHKDMTRKEEIEIEHEVDEEIPDDHIHIAKAFFFVLLSIFTLAYGADILVQGSVTLAKMVGISESVIGLTIVAVGSSAPELAACIVAAQKHHPDIVAGNIIGSNLLNIMAGLSAAAIITPINVSDTFINYDNWVMLGATITLTIVMFWLKKVNHGIGIIFVISYFVYISSKFLVL